MNILEKKSLRVPDADYSSVAESVPVSGEAKAVDPEITNSNNALTSTQNEPIAHIPDAESASLTTVDGGEGGTVVSGATPGKPPGGQFLPGQSGNPHGRPKGSRNKATVIAEAMIDGAAKQILEQVIERGSKGEPFVLRALLPYILAPRRERPVEFELPDINSAADCAKAASAVVRHCAEGTLTPGEADQVMRLIDCTGRRWETAVVEVKFAEERETIARMKEERNEKERNEKEGKA